MKLRLIFLVEKGTRKAAKLQIKGNCVIEIGMRKEKQFSSPPSGQGAKGKAPLGLFQAEPSPKEFFQISHSTCRLCHSRVVIFAERKAFFFFFGGESSTKPPQNLKQHKLSPGHD